MIKLPECANGILLDKANGDKTSIQNFERKNNFKFTYFLNLVIDEELLYERVTNRLVHVPSGRNYNTVTAPPKV
jgi:hypothetical protein